MSFNYQISNIISRARRLIDDNDATDYDWEDSEFFDVISDGRRLLIAERPDARILTSGDPVVLTDVVDVTDEFLLDDTWAPAVAAYVGFRYFGDDAGEHRDLDRSESNYDLFLKLLNML